MLEDKDTRMFLGFWVFTQSLVNDYYFAIFKKMVKCINKDFIKLIYYKFNVNGNRKINECKFCINHVILIVYEMDYTINFKI